MARAYGRVTPSSRSNCPGAPVRAASIAVRNRIGRPGRGRAQSRDLGWFLLSIAAASCRSVGATGELRSVSLSLRVAPNSRLLSLASFEHATARPPQPVALILSIVNQQTHETNKLIDLMVVSARGAGEAPCPSLTLPLDPVRRAADKRIAEPGIRLGLAGTSEYPFFQGVSGEVFRRGTTSSRTRWKIDSWRATGSCWL